MRKLLLLFSLCLSVGAWAQVFEFETSSDEGMELKDRTITITLSGNWLDGENVTQCTSDVLDTALGLGEGMEYGRVIVKSAEGSTVTVNQALVRQLVTGKLTVTESGNAWTGSPIVYLDLSDVAVEGYVGHAGDASEDPNATFYASNGGVTSNIKYLAMPAFAASVPEADRVIPAYTIAWMANLEEIILPVNAKKVGQAAFANVDFDKFKLNQGLEVIGNSAFWAKNARTGMETLEIPSSVKYIGPGAFNFRIYTDIYFHSAQAPICPIGKSVINGQEVPFLYSICYDGNGGQNTTDGDDYESGYANRSNYKNASYWFIMIHFPSSAECAERGETLDVSSYKDATRVYHKVYGTVYGQATDDKSTVEIGVAGKEQEYLEREKVWHFVNGHDWVGDETTPLSYTLSGESKTTMIESKQNLVPDSEVGYGYVTSGYEDTYRGLNYIWPSQSQYIRAYVTVANGVNWDGVTKYRPELTDAQIAYMVEDGLSFDLNGKAITVGNGYVYDEADAIAYNATLPGAIKEGDAKESYNQEEAEAFNAALPGAVVAGQEIKYTQAEVEEYNAQLTGAISTEMVKEPAVEAQDAVYYTNDDIVWIDQVSYDKNTVIYHEAQGAVYYDKESEITLVGSAWYKNEDVLSLDGYYTAEYLSGLGLYDYQYLWNQTITEDGVTKYQFKGNAVKSGATNVGWNDGNPIVKTPAQAEHYEVTTTSVRASSGEVKTPAVEGHGDIYYTQSEVSAYNAALTGAISTEDVKGTASAEDAANYNASLPGAKQAGDAKAYTAEQANAINANLPGAKTAGYDIYYTQAEADAYNQEHGITLVHAGDVQTPGQDAVYYTQDEADAENANHLVADENGVEPTEEGYVTTYAEGYTPISTSDIKTPAVPAVYYNNETAAAENETRGAKTTASVLRQATQDDANAYNATLYGATQVGDPILYSAAEAIANNAALEGSRAAGYTVEKNYDDPAVADYLSMIAFQSTRRCVFAANDGRGDDYKINIPNSKAWWTICLPFDLTKAQIDKYFGVGTHVCLFNQVDRDTNPSDGSKPYVKFYFTDDQYVGKDADDVVLEAHVPYMIFPTIDENDAVYLANGIPMDEFYIKTGNPTPTVVTASDGAKYRFIGNYDTMLPVEDAEGNVTTKAVTVPEYSYIYAKKNGAAGKHPYQFWFVQNPNIPWGANKCVIQSTEKDRGLTDNDTFFSKTAETVNGGSAKQITVFAYDEDEYNEETAIEEVIFVAGSGDDQQVIYSTTGVQLNSTPNKGVYIKNGKKYIAR